MYWKRLRRVTAAPRLRRPVARSANWSMIWEPAWETKVYAKWEGDRCQNQASWVPKSFTIHNKSAKVRSKIYENRSMKPSWSDLVPSWLEVKDPWPILGPSLGLLGASWLQEGGSWAILGSKLGPKINQNWSQERSERLSIRSSFWRLIFEQNRSKFGVDLRAVFERISVSFFVEFCTQHNIAEGTNVL